MQSMCGVRVFAAVGALAMVAACGTRGAPLRYGVLTIEKRSFEYRSNIEWWTLPNQLAVAVIPDEHASTISVDVRYKVGSADEAPGKTGLAHLAEHMMFGQRAVAGGPSFFEQLGASTLVFNGYTNFDSTHYFEVALPAQLDALLALEARRMAIGCGGLSDEDFAHGRAVVEQELAYRSANAFSGTLDRAVFGPQHPYSHAVLGTDVPRLTRADVCAFIDAHYAPNNAVLVVSGRVDPRALRPSIARQFGAIARRETDRAVVVPSVRPGEALEVVGPSASASALVVVQAAPAESDDWIYQRLAAVLLEWRLQRFARQSSWARGATRGTLGGARNGAWCFELEVREPARLADAAAKIYELAAQPIWESEASDVVGVAAARQNELLDDLESVQLRGQRVAAYLEFATHRQFQNHELALLQAVDVHRLEAALARIAPKTTRVVRLLPNQSPSDSALATTPEIDAPIWRAAVDPDEAKRPLPVPVIAPRRIIDATLGNGLRVIMSPDFTQPRFEARLVFPAGERPGVTRPGLAAAASSQLADHSLAHGGDRDRDAMYWVHGLGASEGRMAADHSTFRVRGFSLFADWHVWLLFARLDTGRYGRDAIDNLRRSVREMEAMRAGAGPHIRAQLAAELGWRQAMRDAIYGPRYPRAFVDPFEEGAAYAGLQVSDLEAFRAAHYGAAGATLILVGNFDPVRMRAVIDSLFGEWPAGRAAPPERAMAPVPARGPTRVAVASDDAAQVRVTYAFAPTSARTDARTRAARAVLVAMLDARIQAIRERLGASYGVRARYDIDTAGDVLWLDGLVAVDRAGQALRLLDEALEGLRAGDAALAEDFVRARRVALGKALGDPMRSDLEAARLEDAISYGLPLDAARLPAEVAATTLDDIRAVIAQDLQPARMAVVLVGRPEATDGAFRAAGAAAYRRIGAGAAKR